MIDLKALLKDKGIINIALIDDGFDEIPQPSELIDADWDSFFDDLQGTPINKIIEDRLPNFNNKPSAELKNSLEFIAILWELRKSLPEGLYNHLFQAYETSSTNNLCILNELVQSLEELELSCETMGRNLNDSAMQADLVFIDLFLGYPQKDEDIEQSIIRIKELISGRANKPPLVILMSSSSRLTNKRDYFRDEAGLLGSTFRVARKTDLQDINFLSRLLTRLANHYDDAQRVAAFVDAWDKGLDKAKGRFIKAVRRLDLSDLAQIHGLLLDFEGQALGDYLLDVTDRVLQHEIEGDANTIAAAKDLNKINLNNYPAPHLKGSANLQSIVYQMLFQHPERLKLSENNEEKPVQFGDIYCYQNQNSDGTKTVLLVVTPACDLARCGVQDILLLPGAMKHLNSTHWRNNSLLQTSVITLDDGENHWIEWNLKKRHTISGEKILEELRNHSLSHLGRLREIYTIELQQQLFIDMARIGQIANPPTDFPVSISLFSVSGDFSLKLLDIEELNAAVCFVGRGLDANSRISRLILSEGACDAFQKLVRDLPENDVPRHLKSYLVAMKKSASIFEQFERGTVEVKAKPYTIVEEGSHYVTIVTKEKLDKELENGGELTTNSFKKAPLLMSINDLSNVDDSESEDYL